MKRILIALPFLLLAGCGGGEDVPFIPPLDYSREAPITLNVATIQVVDEYVPPKTLPHVEHAAPTPPYRAVRLWADQRLHAVGANGYVRVGIKDASIVEKQLIGQSEYDGRLDVSIDGDAGDGLHTATSEITISRQIVTDKDQDLAAKERIWDTLTREMMADFDKGAANAIANNLGQFTGVASAGPLTAPTSIERSGATGGY